jgi:hypothetical protein
MPPSTHRWNQSWAVLLGPYRSGSWSHWQPLRIRNRIALSIVLQFATLRPVDFLGQYSLRIGSIRSQSGSGISQIVPSGWRRDVRRAMVAAPGVMHRDEMSRYILLQAKGVPAVLG